LEALEAREAVGGAASRRRILQLAWPAVCQSSLDMFVWMADTAMVGRLGAVALSAVGLGGHLAFTVLFVVGALGIGTMAIVARCAGAGEPENAGRAVGQGLLIGTVAGLAVAAALYAAAPWIYAVSGLGPDVAVEGVAYLRIVAPAMAFLIPGRVAAGALRGSGDTRTPFLVTGFANLLNLVGDYVLIFGYAGFPRMGVRGAALAASVSLGLSGVAFVLLLARGGPLVRPTWRGGLVNLSFMRRLVCLSIPAGLEEALLDGARTVVLFVVAALGKVPLAAMQVAIAAESLSFMPGYGFTIASSILAGQHLGAGRREAARQDTWQAVAIAACVMGSIGVLFLLFPRQIVSVFTTDPAVVALAAPCLWVAAFAQPMMAVTEVLAGAYRGAGDTRFPMYLAAVGGWVVRIPLTMLVVYFWRMTIVEVYWIMVLDWACRGAVAAYFFSRGRWMTTRL